MTTRWLIGHQKFVVKIHEKHTLRCKVPSESSVAIFVVSCTSCRSKSLTHPLWRYHECSIPAVKTSAFVSLPSTKKRELRVKCTASFVSSLTVEQRVQLLSSRKPVLSLALSSLSEWIKIEKSYLERATDLESAWSRWLKTLQLGLWSNAQWYNWLVKLIVML